MIPKKIHYCWFGGASLNKLGRKCLDSWKTFFPDYEIIEWNESNVDLHACDYVAEAYEAKKWAFVSDYVRFKVLYEQGGLYFDTDVEVIRSFDDILAKGNFMGSEREASADCPLVIAPGLGLGVEPGLAVCKDMLDIYHKTHFKNEDGSYNFKTVVDYMTDVFSQYGLQQTNDIQCVADVYIYPHDYFCPIDMETYRLRVTERTHSIHHYAASWVPAKERFRGKVYALIHTVFGEKLAKKARSIFGKK